jgi:hypothetical protein
VSKRFGWLLAAIAAWGFAPPAPGGEGKSAQQPDPRKFSLKRCDQLADKARLECLEKARQDIMDARGRRAGEKEAPPPPPSEDRKAS